MDLSAILIDLIDLNSLNSEVLPQKWNPEVEKKICQRAVPSPKTV